MKTEQRASPWVQPIDPRNVQPDPFGAPACRMVLIYLVIPVVVLVYTAAMKA